MTCCSPCSLRRSRRTKWTNFVECVKNGQPTAIFEDPYPWPQLYPEVVGTAQQKRPPGGMMGMFGGGGGPPEPKGDISQLWKLLGVEMLGNGNDIVWQEFNPEPKLGEIRAGMVVHRRRACRRRPWHGPSV